MNAAESKKPEKLTIVVVCASVFFFCIAATLCFYGYGLNETVDIYPYQSKTQLFAVIFRIASIAALISLLPLRVAVRKSQSPRTAAQWSGVGTLVPLVLYGFAGCGGVLGNEVRIGNWHASTNFLFPSLYFSEFNFLTFIFEVAPVTALLVGVVVYLLLRFKHTAQGN